MPYRWRPKPLTHNGCKAYDFSLNCWKHFMIREVEAVYDVLLEKLKVCLVTAPSREYWSEILCV